MAAFTMKIEPVLAFNGMDVLVARDEGLFEAEGIDLQIVHPPTGERRSEAGGTLAKPVTNQGRLQDRGEAYLFQG